MKKQTYPALALAFAASASSVAGAPPQALGFSQIGGADYVFAEAAEPTQITEISCKEEFAASVVKEIEDACADPRNFEEGETAPNSKAISDLIAIIVEAESLRGSRISNGDVSPYFGELSVTWINGSRMLRLTSFSGDRSPRLDFGTTPVGALGQYEFDDSATGAKLAERLFWISDPNG